MEIAKELDALFRDKEECQACTLYDNRQCFIRGAGNHQAKLLFLSSKPSKDDIAAGLPITEPHKGLIESFLQSLDLSLDDVWVTTTVACGQEDGKDPKPKQYKTCRTWLAKEIHIIQPTIIVALGNLAVKSLIPKRPPNFGEVIGRTIDVKIAGDLIEYTYPAFITYALGYLLRSQDTSPGGLWNKFFNHLKRAFEISNKLEELRGY